MSEVLKPNLYAVNGTSSAPSHPLLRGGVCAQCGYVFFPLQTYGCEMCGRHDAALQPLALSGCGRLVAWATVHIHDTASSPAKSGIRPIEAPFTIGSIALDDGPTIRAILVEADETMLRPGQRMGSKLVAVGSGDKTMLDLRFTPAPRPTAGHDCDGKISR